MIDNEKIIIETRALKVSYGASIAVDNVSIKIPEKAVTAIIGPSGCGKSTLLRVFNRMNDFVLNIGIKGEVFFKGKSIYDAKTDPVEIRKIIGMVFQKPNPFPKSIYNNIIWGPKIHGYKDDPNELVETALKKAYLWEEVKNRLNDTALSLSGGQQQRLCIARAVAMKPEVILMDEPCSALDPISTSKIEDLITEMKQDYTIVTVTHNMQQAARISDYTAFLYNGKLVEFGKTAKIFTKPEKKQTEDYITGRFG